MSEPLLTVKDLMTYFATPNGIVRAVDGATFTVEKGKTLCLIGESGSGKSVSALSVIGLVDSVPGIVGGEIYFDGKNLVDGIDSFCSVSTGSEKIEIDKDTRGWRKKHASILKGIRGKKIAMIFQEPVSSLNPLYSVGAHLTESLRLSEPNFSQEDIRKRAIDWLDRVKIASPHEVIDAYPFQLSGGMAQRVMIAVALSGYPDLLIADEPTTSLDATIQLEILRLLRSLQQQLGLSILFITHDIGIGAHFADDIAVMYAGRVVESGPRDDFFKSDRLHPYTSMLLESVHSGRRKHESEPRSEKPVTAGCRFAPRCGIKHTLPEDGKICEESEPDMISVSEGHLVRCWKYEKQ
jgi:peptide/nickel transport system ATP-binding protein